MQQERFLIFGKHAAIAAIKNPNRNIASIFIAKDKKAAYIPFIEQSKLQKVSFCDNNRISKICGKDALHQGIVVITAKLLQPDLQDILEGFGKRSLLVMLDNVTDPFNVGNILRSAKAFGADAVIMKERHSPSETSIIAKTASGALEAIPICTVTNLINTVKLLQKNDYFCYALDVESNIKLSKAKFPDKTTFVLGSEGKGVSSILKCRCDAIISIPMKTESNFDSINVSNAAAIAMYEFYATS